MVYTISIVEVCKKDEKFKKDFIEIIKNKLKQIEE